MDLYRLKVQESIGDSALKIALGKNLDPPQQLLWSSTLNRKWIRLLIESLNVTSDDDIAKALTRLRNSNVPSFLSGHKQVDFTDNIDYSNGAIQVSTISHLSALRL